MTVPKELDLVTIAEAARRMRALGYTGLTEYRVRQLVDGGDILHFPCGNRKMISLEDLAAYIMRSKKRP